MCWMKKYEKNLVNTNVITQYNIIVVSSEMVEIPFQFIQTPLHFFQ